MSMDSSLFQLSFISQAITCFDSSFQHIIVGGKYLPYLIVKDLNKKTEEYFKLPPGCRGIDQLQLLRDKNLLAFLSEGYFYIVDLSTTSTCNGKIQTKLNIRVPNEKLSVFDIDFNMNSLLMGSTNGHVYLYDLPKALENERILNKKKLEMGVEDYLVYTYLESVKCLDFLESQQRNNPNHLKSTLSGFDHNPTQASFIKGLISHEHNVMNTI